MDFSIWRRGGDSNSRDGANRLHDFESCAFNHSATSPYLEIVAGNTGLRNYIDL